MKEPEHPPKEGVGGGGKVKLCSNEQQMVWLAIAS